MIDTHTHLYLDEFENNGVDAVRRALDAGVSGMILPCVAQTSVRPMIALNSACPDCTWLAAGLHPTEVDSSWREHLEEIMRLTADLKIIAIGEVGMDLYWDKSYVREQSDALATQIDIANDRKLPMIIHCREAINETAEVFDSFDGNIPSAVFHSFTGGCEDVERLRSTSDFYFGINGVVTFKNAHDLREALPVIGIDRILLETDSPYLAPMPFRGKRNESGYLLHIAMKVAEILGINIEEVKETTDRNALRLFNLNNPTDIS